MKTYTIDRKTILEALRSALAQNSHVCAMWEAGAAAFGRVDEWSDIDLMIDAEDDHVTKVLDQIDQTLETLSPFDIRFQLPQPTWHGHEQVIYRLKETSPFLLVDVAVMKHSNPNKFLGSATHGTPLVHLDRRGVVNDPPRDEAESRQARQNRLQDITTVFDLFRVLTLKEIHRGNDLEAIPYYHRFTLQPLVEVLGMLYRPDRSHFYTRYIHYDLPREVLDRLRPMFYVRDLVDLRQRREEAEDWFTEISEELFTNL